LTWFGKCFFARGEHNVKTILPRIVSLHEVALRDGIQNEKVIVSTEEKIRLIDRLADCGIRQIEVSSFVNPRLVPQMSDAEDLWEKIKRRDGVRYSALILSEKGLDRAIQCRVPHVGIFVSASETHSRKNSNKTIAEALEEAIRLIHKARSAGMDVRAGVMNAFGCVYEGRTPVETVTSLVSRYLEAGPHEICLADSSGLGNPVQMKDVLQRVKAAIKDMPLALHLHNTRGAGLANLFSALEEGISSFDTSLGGLGGCPFIRGARGNIATEDTVSMLHEMGIETGIDLEALIQASLDFEKVMQQTFPAMVTHLCEAKG
jgi:hydroxymethylglutaryl-CoA lyase